MPFVARAPDPPLDAFVRTVWHSTNDVTRGFEWVLPTGGCQLVVQLGARPNRWTDARGQLRETSSAAIGGPFVEPVGLRSGDLRAVTGALFHPGGLAALLGHPIRVLLGAYVDVTDLLGAESARWVDAVRGATDPHSALGILQRGLLGHLQRRSRRRALELACDALGAGRPVAEVARGLGASQRRFSRTFTDETGLTPKQYTRLQRFRRAVDALRRRGPGDLATLALECGYYDQAHLNHEFRSWAAMTPRQVLAGEGPFTNHVHVRTSEPLRESR